MCLSVIIACCLIPMESFYLKKKSFNGFDYSGVFGCVRGFSHVSWPWYSNRVYTESVDGFELCGLEIHLSFTNVSISFTSFLLPIRKFSFLIVFLCVFILSSYIYLGFLGSNNLLFEYSNVNYFVIFISYNFLEFI